MTILSFIGWLFSGVIKFVPGIPTIVVYGLAMVAVVGLPAGYGYHKGSEGKFAAIAAEKMACNSRVTYGASLDVLHNILQSEDEAMKLGTDPGAATLCKQSQFCRKGEE